MYKKELKAKVLKKYKRKKAKALKKEKNNE